MQVVRPQFVQLVDPKERLNYIFSPKGQSAKKKKLDPRLAYRRIGWGDYLLLYREAQKKGLSTEDFNKEVQQAQFSHIFVSAHNFYDEEGVNLDSYFQNHDFFDFEDEKVGQIVAILLNCSVQETAMGTEGKIGLKRKLKKARFELNEKLLEKSENLKEDFLMGRLQLEDAVKGWQWVYSDKFPLDFAPAEVSRLPLGTALTLIETLASGKNKD